MTGSTPTVREATGYSLVLPPGWVQIPLDEDAAPAVRRLLDRAFSDVPPDIPPDTIASLRRRLEGRLTATLAAARRTGGTELYLPTKRMGGVLVPASFVVGDVAPWTGDGRGDPRELVPRVLTRMLADDDDARAVEVDGAPGVRTESTVAPDADGEAALSAASRRVDYVVAVPGRAGRWLSASCTVLEAADDEHDLTGLLVELFDAVMTTFRWAAP
ncbi:hypothetical protein E4P40_05725 [Blastococcus sp. CT_GayMR20]|uniref:hypothetical protein n=1 Tax=Blastococcus sp. CT_GayMR20 TaxID=2559609 RepID=UPI0010740D51|nr:hypothetical protein [Blastococcus sp. CT_GayMR20]TFV91652.1 hypothetical protein E4P40_05725 [Blastococcus sp. CT_GayMR20]